MLLLVAPKEHRVRIEVGYGLEGTLTDAISKLIIVNAIAPRFKAGDFDGGVTRGVDDIITVLTTDSSEWQKKPDLRAKDDASWLDAVVAVPVVHPDLHSLCCAMAAAAGAAAHLHVLGLRARRRLAAAAVAAAAAGFRAAAARRAAAALRGVGDGAVARRPPGDRSRVRRGAGDARARR